MYLPNFNRFPKPVPMLGYRRKPVREAVSALGWIYEYGSYILVRSIGPGNRFSACTVQRRCGEIDGEGSSLNTYNEGEAGRREPCRAGVRRIKLVMFIS